MKKVGYSLSGCLVSIARGEVAIEDVAYIVASTAYRDRSDMMNALAAMRGPEADVHLANARVLWDTGRIFQASVRPSGRRPIEPLWRDATTGEAFMDIGVRGYTVHKSQGGTWDEIMARPAMPADLPGMDAGRTSRA